MGLFMGFKESLIGIQVRDSLNQILFGYTKTFKDSSLLSPCWGTSIKDIRKPSLKVCLNLSIIKGYISILICMS